MNEAEKIFFDELDNHVKLLAANPTPINMDSRRFIFSLLLLAQAVTEKWIETEAK